MSSKRHREDGAAPGSMSAYLSGQKIVAVSSEKLDHVTMREILEGHDQRKKTKAVTGITPRIVAKELLQIILHIQDGLLGFSQSAESSNLLIESPAITEEREMLLMQLEALEKAEKFGM
jgi:hypothetical protein